MGAHAARALAEGGRAEVVPLASVAAGGLAPSGGAGLAGIAKDWQASFESNVLSAVLLVEAVRADLEAHAGVPAGVRAAIEELCGAPVVTARTQPGGFSPGVAARL